MKISTGKKETLMYDGQYISNGHWAISARAAMSSGITLSEPYQFLVEKKIQFRKLANQRPMLEATLPNLGEVMSVGTREATITDIQIGGKGLVEWRGSGARGVAEYRPEYLEIFTTIEKQCSGTFWVNHEETLSLCGVDGEILGVVMPLKGDKEALRRQMKGTLESLQMEIAQICEQKSDG